MEKAIVKHTDNEIITALTPTWALTRFAKLFWSLASVRVVCVGGTVDSGVLLSNGKMPKLGVSGLIGLLNMLR